MKGWLSLLILLTGLAPEAHARAIAGKQPVVLPETAVREMIVGSAAGNWVPNFFCFSAAELIREAESNQEFFITNNASVPNTGVVTSFAEVTAVLQTMQANFYNRKFIVTVDTSAFSKNERRARIYSLQTSISYPGGIKGSKQHTFNFGEAGQQFSFGGEPWDWRTCGDGSWIFWSPPLYFIAIQILDAQPNQRFNPDPLNANMGDPMNMFNGNVSLNELDLHIPSPGLPLSFRRSYNSTADRIDGDLGPKWSHSYDLRFYTTNTVFAATTNEWYVLDTGSDWHWLPTDSANTNAQEVHNGLFFEVEPLPGGAHEVQLGLDSFIRFDANGVVQTAGDGFGNELTMSYSNNLLARVEHSNGLGLDFHYGLSNHLARVDSPSSNLWVELHYNAIGELTNATRFVDGIAQHRSYRYDDAPGWNNHSLTQHIGVAGSVSAWDYATNALGQTTSRAYRSYGGSGEHYWETRIEGSDEDDVATVHYIESGTTNSFTYRLDRLTQRVMEMAGPDNFGDRGHFETFREVDDFGNPTNLVTQTWAEDGVHEEITSITWSNKGRYVTSVATGYDAEPTNTWTFTWNTNLHALSSLTDPRGVQTRIDYEGNLLSAVHEVVSSNQLFTTSFGYTSNGLVRAVTNANNHHVHLAYDALGNVTNVAPQAGVPVSYEYNLLGNLDRVTVPGAQGPRSTTLKQNSLGYVDEVIFHDNSSDRFFYDQQGNLVSNRTWNGTITSNGFNEAGLLTHASVFVPESNTWIGASLHYDDQQRIKALEDPQGRTVRAYRYKKDGSLESTVNLLGQSQTVHFVSASLLDSVNRFDGSSISFGYDGAGRIDRLDYPGGHLQARFLSNGLLATLDDGAVSISNRFDVLNRLEHLDGAGPADDFDYRYDPVGNVTGVTTVLGDIHLSYDAAERLDTQSTPGGDFSYDYNPVNGGLGSVHYPNGIQGNFAYDDFDRLTNITWSVNGAVIRSLGYELDDRGFIGTVQREDQSTKTYHYNSLGQLTNELARSASGRVQHQAAYRYDPSGNRTRKVTGGIELSYAYSNNQLSAWTVVSSNGTVGVDVRGSANELLGTAYGVRDINGGRPEVVSNRFVLRGLQLEVGTTNIIAVLSDAAGNPGAATNTVQVELISGAQYAYDAAGCLTNLSYAGGTTLGFSWNGLYELTAVATNGVNAESYLHDPLGRRYGIVSGGVTNFLVCSGIDVLAETDAAGTVLRSYQHGPALDDIQAMTIHGESETNTYYYLKDHLGSVLAITDAAGAVVEQYDYDAFGRPRVYDGDGFPLAESAIGNRYTFQGREYAWRTGLYFHRSRWYDPVSARWISRDPKGMLAGFNDYAFLGNNPIHFTDPFGTDQYDRYQQWADAGYQRGGITGHAQAIANWGVIGLSDALGGQIVRYLFDKSGEASGAGDVRGTLMYGAGGVGIIALSGYGGVGTARLGNGVWQGLRGNAADDLARIPINNNTARTLLKKRGATKQQAQQTVDAFDGQIYVTQGRLGEQFIVTETSIGTASGFWVTRGSAAATPAERIRLLALPSSNKALVEEPVILTRNQLLLEGRVASQAGNPGFGLNATGGGPQVVTDAFRGGIRRP